MNSKQLNFFLMPEDLSNILEFFKSQECCILESFATSIGEFEVSDEVFLNSDVGYFYLAQQGDQSGVAFGLTTKKDKYYLDSTGSRVIRFTYGGMQQLENNKYSIGRCRLHLQVTFSENGVIISKDERFVKWAVSLINSFKRKFVKKSDLDDSFLFFSDAAITWSKANGAKLDSGGFNMIQQ